jgi:hypothetical protein
MIFMGIRRAAIKLDFDQTAEFTTDIGSASEELQVEVDVEAGEAVKLDMFVSAEVRTLTEVLSNVLLIGLLTGTDIDDPPLAVERIFIPAAAGLSIWDGSLSMSWIVEPPTPGTKTYTFNIDAIGTGNQITFNARGLNAMAFKTIPN